MGMRMSRYPTYRACYWLVLACSSILQADPCQISLQADGSLVVYDSKGSIADLVKQGTPRQSINCSGQSANVSYGFNSSGKKTILLSLAKNSVQPVEFMLGDDDILVPPGSSLRLTLDNSNQAEKIDGSPPGTVVITKTVPQNAHNGNPPAAESTPMDQAEQTLAPEIPAAMSTPSTADTPLFPHDTKSTPAAGYTSQPANVPTPISNSPTWPGRLLDRPIPPGQMEEAPCFYIRLESGPRFVSPMNIVNVTGGGSGSNPIIQKEIGFNTGYRQDIDAGVWLTDWFGLAVETGFALNGIRGHTSGMTVSDGTYWSIPLMAQLCFQYPNDSGFLPYINLGFGGGWNYFNIGSINYNQPGYTTISGTGRDLNNAYQISAGVRYRIYEQFSLTLAYKFYGTTQPSMGLDNNQQVTFGSPSTSSVQIGGNLAF